MPELAHVQQRLLDEITEMSTDPQRRHLTRHQILVSLREDWDTLTDSRGNRGPTLAERHGMTEGQLDEVLTLLASEPATVSSPVSPAPAGPKATPAPAVAERWDVTCTRHDGRTCIHSWAEGYIHAVPGDLCPGCARWLVGLVTAALDVDFGPGWRRWTEGGDGRG